MPPRHMLACIAPTWWSMHPTATYAGLQPTAPCCTLWPAHTNAYEHTNPRAGLHMQMDRYKHPRTCWPAPHATQEALRRRLANRTAVNERTMRQHTQEATALKRAADAARLRIKQLESENKSQKVLIKVRPKSSRGGGCTLKG